MIRGMVILALIGAVGFAVYYSDQYSVIELIVGGVIAVCFSLIFTLPAAVILDEKAQDVTKKVYKRKQELPPVHTDDNGRKRCECGAPVLVVGDRIYYGCDCTKGK